jgi:hypothetical protein
MNVSTQYPRAVAGDEVRSRRYRNMAMIRARSFTGFMNQEIGKFFGGISYSALTKARDSLNEALQNDGATRKMGEEVKDVLSRFKSRPLCFCPNPY